MDGRVVAIGLLTESFALSWPLLAWEIVTMFGLPGAYWFVQWGLYIIVLPTLVAGIIILYGLAMRGSMRAKWATGFMVSSIVIGLYGLLLSSLLGVGVGQPASVLAIFIFVLNYSTLAAAFMGSWNSLRKLEFPEAV